MNNRLTKILQICGVVTVIGLLTLISIKYNPGPKKLSISEAILYMQPKSKTFNTQYARIQSLVADNKIKIEYKLGHISSKEILGTTEVIPGDIPKFIITLDRDKITAYHDLLDLALVHELAHVFDASTNYGATVSDSATAFIAQANKDKQQLKWEERAVERYAVEVEDITRIELKYSGDERYKNLITSRMEVIKRQGLRNR